MPVGRCAGWDGLVGSLNCEVSESSGSHTHPHAGQELRALLLLPSQRYLTQSLIIHEPEMTGKRQIHRTQEDCAEDHLDVPIKVISQQRKATVSWPGLNHSKTLVCKLQTFPPCHGRLADLD